MVAVKTGLAPPPMMPNQPQNMMPPPMPVPPMGQPMQFGQQPVGALPAAAGTFPVSADRRRRFGDSLETMLASRRQPVASDQMAGMNVFTGQMMNTAARPPVVQMRNGGIVRNMRRGGYSMADYSSPAFTSYTSSKKNTFAPTAGTPGKAVKTHDEIMASIRGGSSPNDDKPAPKPVVTAPVVPMNFGDDEDYTPTSAELNEAMKDMAAIGMPDMRSDTSAVDYSSLGNLDDRDARTAQTLASPSLAMVQMPRGTGGLSSVPPVVSIPSSSSTLAQNMITFPESPDTSMQPGPAYSPSPFPDELMTQPFNNVNVTPTFLPDELITEPFNSANVTPVSLPDELTGVPFNNLGLGSSEAEKVYSGRGSGAPYTGTGSDTTDDPKTIGEHAQNFMKQFLAIPGNIASDFQMALDAGLLTGLLGGYEAMEKKLLEVRNPDGSLKYTPDQVKDYIFRTQQKQALDKKMAEEASKNKSTDDDGPMSSSVVNPCPEGYVLDSASGICVPVEEAEEEGPSLSLNRTRDTEFEELDDIMKRIVKPVDDPVKMQAGGSVGLNRAADNFLAAMGA